MEGGSQVSVQISNHTENFFVDDGRVCACLQFLMSELGMAHFWVDVAFVSPERMRELNQTYRDKNTSTDVLSFPQLDWPVPLAAPMVEMHPTAAHHRSLEDPPRSLGDIIVSLEDAEKNAVSLGHQLEREVVFLLIHGLLHLCGHDHQEPEEEALMLQQQRLLLDGLAGKDPYPVWAQMVGRVTES